MSPDEQGELFLWLDGQSDIISLALPNLVEKGDENSDHCHSLSKSRISTSPHTSPNITPGSSPMTTPLSSSFPPVHAPTPLPFSSPSLLPALTTLCAPPNLVALLAPRRPLTHATLLIHSTLYTGLRPSALMSALRGVKTLAVKFGENMDRRSVEKLLGAAGATLGEVPEKGHNLQVLEVEVAWFGTGSDEVSMMQ